MKFSVYNQKLKDLLDDNNTYEQISSQTVLDNINNFNKSYKKLISKEDKSWPLLINYHHIIPKFMASLKPCKLNIPPRPDISGIGSTSHNIAQLLTKILSPLLGTISDAHNKNSESLLNKLIDIDMNHTSLTSLDILYIYILPFNLDMKV